MNPKESIESFVANSNENTYNFSFSPEDMSQITEYYHGRFTHDINEMVGHIVNTLQCTKEGVAQNEDKLIELEKCKCIIRIQQSLIHMNNILYDNKPQNH